MWVTVPVSRFAELEAHAKETGLTADTAWRYAVIAWWTEHFGHQAPRIVSGRRSQERQDELRRRWDHGDRTGLTTRPAERSTHTEGKGFDLERTPTLAYMAALAPYIGLRWGGDFSEPDVVHFDTGKL